MKDIILWEEKNSTEQIMNSEIKSVLEMPNITENIVSKSKKNVCEDIKVKRYKRKIWQRNWRKNNPEKSKTTNKKTRLVEIWNDFGTI